MGVGGKYIILYTSKLLKRNAVASKLIVKIAGAGVNICLTMLNLQGVKCIL